MICAHCGSSFIVKEYDDRNRITGYRCGMCGRNKFEEKQAIGTGQEARGSQNPSPATGGGMSHKLCIVEGCTKLQVKDHLCTTHYREKHGVPPKDKGKCSVQGCGKSVFKDHKCHKHYSEASGVSSATGKSKAIRCSVEGCGKWAIAEGLCYRHVSLKYGGPDKNPYRDIYNTRKRKLAKQGAAALAAAAPSSLDLTGDVVMAGALPSPASSPVIAKSEETRQSQSLPSSLSHLPSAILSQEVYKITDGNGRKAVIAFSFIDGKKVYAEVRMGAGTFDCMAGTYDDWIFLAAIGNEIRRIQGECINDKI
jgi:hypothetical protein